MCLYRLHLQAMNAQLLTVEPDALADEQRADVRALDEQWLADEQARADLAKWFARIERERAEAGCFI